MSVVLASRVIRKGWFSSKGLVGCVVVGTIALLMLQVEEAVMSSGANKRLVLILNKIGVCV